MTHGTDSAYSRLSSAWSGDGRALLVKSVQALDRNRVGGVSLVAEKPVERSEAPRVLVVRRVLRLPDNFYCGLVASERCDRIYRIDPLSASSLDVVMTHCQNDAPRLLLIDLGLLRSADPRDVYLLRTRFPSTDWMVVNDGPVLAADIEPYAWARGCIDWTMGPQTLGAALDAVMAGHLWFSRGLVEKLYLALLGRWSGEEANTAPPADTSGTHQRLTSRESEVLVLIRGGLTNKEIGERLDISVNTVKKHLAHALEKRGLHKRRQVWE